MNFAERGHDVRSKASVAQRFKEQADNRCETGLFFRYLQAKEAPSGGEHLCSIRAACLQQEKRPKNWPAVSDFDFQWLI